MSKRNRSRKPQINWERAEILHTGRPKEEPVPKPAPEPEPEPELTIHNEFTRRITGFSPEALEIILEHGFKALDARGFISVKFVGISRKPDKDITYKNPTLLESRDRKVVLSGVVDKKSVSEIGNGNGSYPMQQAERPRVQDHDSARRLNVALGDRPEGFDPDALANELLSSGLSLSAVDSINGTQITPDLLPWEVNGLWNRRQETY